MSYLLCIWKIELTTNYIGRSFFCYGSEICRPAIRSLPQTHNLGALRGLRKVTLQARISEAHITAFAPTQEHERRRDGFVTDIPFFASLIKELPKISITPLLVIVLDVLIQGVPEELLGSIRWSALFREVLGDRSWTNSGMRLEIHLRPFVGGQPLSSQLRNILAGEKYLKEIQQDGSVKVLYQ